MFASFPSFFSFFLSPWGLLLLASLDSSIFFFAPLANDAVLVILTARHNDLFWLYPLMATAGSLIGLATTFWIGQQIGEQGLERLIDRRRIARVRAQVRRTGAFALGLLALIPPPFPFTPLVLTSGALEVSKREFFLTLAVVRLARFSVESILALVYGRRIIAWLNSETVKAIVAIFILIAIAGSFYTLYTVVRSTRPRRRLARPAGRRTS